MLFPKSQTQSGWKPTALVIDNDAETHRSIHVLLGNDFDVHHAYFPRLAISLLERQRFHVVITSLEMADTTEVPQLNQRVKQLSESKGFPVIGLTASDAPGTFGSLRCVAKPLDETLFQSALSQALSGLGR